MLPILSGVVLRGRPGGGRGFVLSLAYVLPMALCFALLGALMGMFGASLNLQAQLQSPWVLVPFAAFFALFAVAMFGFFELRLPGFIREPLDRLAGDARGGSILGAATLGVLSSLLVSPCVSAPLAASLLYISASGDAWGGLQLFALGLGMGTPLVVFGAGGGALLPKSGAWMNGVRNAFGVLLLAVAVWLLERVVSGPVALMLWGMLAGGAGLALGALEFTPKSAARRLLQLLGLMFLTYAVAAWIGALQGESDPIHPLGRSVPSIHAGPPSTPGEWQNLTTPAQLDAALAEHVRPASRCCWTGMRTGASVARSSSARFSPIPRCRHDCRPTACCASTSPKATRPSAACWTATTCSVRRRSCSSPRAVTNGATCASSERSTPPGSPNDCAGPLPGSDMR